MIQLASATIKFDGGCAPCHRGGLPTFGWALTGHSAADVPFGLFNATEKDAGTKVWHFEYGICQNRPAPELTCNLAEWEALNDALDWLAENGVRVSRLTIQGDSNLVIQQLNGKWAAKKPHLRELRDHARQTLKVVAAHWHCYWMPRAQNGECDGLARRAYVEEMARRAGKG